MGYLIDRLDHKGRGITKVEDKTTFVENVKNFTNGAITIDINLITPMLPNAIFS